MKSCGSFARFSAQSVSMMPVAGDSVFTTKPDSCQKSRSTGQTLSGGWSTTSQRCEPSRSMCAPATLGSTGLEAPDVERSAARPLSNAEAVRALRSGTV